MCICASHIIFLLTIELPVASHSSIVSQKGNLLLGQCLLNSYRPTILVPSYRGPGPSQVRPATSDSWTWIHWRGGQTGKRWVTHITTVTKSATSHKKRPPIPLCSERSATISVLGMCVIYQLQLGHTGLLVAAC